MFQCQHCGNVVPPRTSAETVVVETRPRVYPWREEAQRAVFRGGRLHKPKHDDAGGRGRETIREIRVCPPCKRALVPDVMVDGQ